MVIRTAGSLCGSCGAIARAGRRAGPKRSRPARRARHRTAEADHSVRRATPAGRDAPPRTRPSGWRRNSRRVTTPKFPPPPRSAQNRSGWTCSLASTTLPSARTTCTDATESAVSPNLRLSQPMPPRRVIPLTPTSGLSPSGRTMPCTSAALVSTPAVTPGPTHHPSTRHVDLDAVERTEVEQQPAVGRAVAGEAVPATLHGELEAVAFC